MRSILLVLLTAALSLGGSPPGQGPAPASPNGTAVALGSGGSIVDGLGNTWTLSSTGADPVTGGCAPVSCGNPILQNGVAMPNTVATLLLYFNGTLYQQNGAGGWWSWTNGGWAGTSDPRKTPSASGTFVIVGMTAGIVDAQGNIWSLGTTVVDPASGNQVLENGAANPGQAILLLYDKGSVYAKNASGNWYFWSNTGFWVAAPVPPTSGLLDIAITFEGLNLNVLVMQCNWDIGTGKLVVTNCAVKAP